MEEIYTVTFAGHRDISEFRRVEERLYTVVKDLLREREYVVFWVGNDGEFDVLAQSVIRRARRSMGEDTSELNLALPYPKAGMNAMKASFSNVIIPDVLAGIHPKGAITERNRWMVDECDLLLCYVAHTGGAARMLQYAKKKGKRVINLYELLQSDG